MTEQGEIGYRLRLFVSGTTPRSLRAIATIRNLCEREVPGRYELEIVDVYEQPAAARANRVVAVPTLIMVAPAPKRLFVGDMSDPSRLLAGLGLANADG